MFFKSANQWQPRCNTPHFGKSANHRAPLSCWNWANHWQPVCVSTPAHKVIVEGVLSVMDVQWTKEQTKLNVTTVGTILQCKWNTDSLWMKANTDLTQVKHNVNETWGLHKQLTNGPRQLNWSGLQRPPGHPWTDRQSGQRTQGFFFFFPVTVASIFVERISSWASPSFWWFHYVLG